MSVDELRSRRCLQQPRANTIADSNEPAGDSLWLPPGEHLINLEEFYNRELIRIVVLRYWATRGYPLIPDFMIADHLSTLSVIVPGVSKLRPMRFVEKWLKLGDAVTS